MPSTTQRWQCSRILINEEVKQHIQKLNHYNHQGTDVECYWSIKLENDFRQIS